LNIVYSKTGLLIQDFIAPFFIFLKSKFKITYSNIDDILHTNEIILNSEIENYFFKYKTAKHKFSITIKRNGVDKIEAVFKNKKITANCITE
jgi:hypothetical protein